MTSSEARAAEVIDHVGNEPSNVIAAALATEGLLAPNLPEPETKPAGWASAPPGTNISEWAVDGLTRAATLPDGTILVHDDGLDVAEDPDTLESIALAYLAAVHAARQALEPTDATD